ncbi:hypothetical protein GCM10009066_04100 [Halarchaeum salinum]|uniref:Uncharacterized protein n=2 Tax=Halarchaeum salinum TaxID=489912 RepID=A0AAV3S4T7_9EURY
MSVALAGCTTGDVGGSGDSGGTDGDGTDGDGTDGAGDGINGGGTTTDTSFAGCPSLRDADRTVCAATAGADVPVVLRPSTTALTSPGTLRFTLSNGGESTLGLNPYDWTVHRETADGWEHVAPDATIEPWREIQPGESQSWVLGVGTEPTAEGDDVACGPLALDARTYAFSVVAQEGDVWTAYVARFRVA